MNDRINININKSIISNLVLIAFSIFLINSQLEISTYNITDSSAILLKLIRYLCYGIFSIGIIFTTNLKRIKLKYFIAFILIMIITFLSKNLGIIVLLMIMCSLRKIEFNRIIRIAYYVNIVTFGFIIISSLLNIIPNWTFLRTEDIVRHSLGYQYCTFASTLFFFFVLMKFYIRKGKFKLHEFIIYPVIASILYYYTNSRTGMILCCLIILSSIVFILFGNNIKNSISKNVNNRIKKIFCFIPVFAVLLSISITLIYASGIKMDKLNELLSYRLYYTDKAFDKYGVTLLGNDVELKGFGGVGYTETEYFEYMFIDNAYLNILINYGIIFLVALTYLYYKCIDKLISKKDYVAIFCISLILMWALIEPSLLSIGKNVFILFLWRKE